MKLHLRRLPIIGYEPYDDTCTEFAFVIQLYDAKYLGHFENLDTFIDEYYIKGAVGVARSLVLNTDVVARRIPIYFHIDDKVADEYLSVLLDAGIRRDRILTLNSLDGLVYKYRASRAFYMMDDPVIRKYDSYVKWDADLFACCDPLLGQKLSTHWLRGHELGCLHFSRDTITNIRDKPDQAHWFDKWCGTRDTFDGNYAITRQNIINVLGIDLLKNEQDTFHNVLSGILRFPHANKLPDGFKDFVFALEPVVGDEELIMSLWVSHSNTWLRNLDPQPMCWRGEQIAMFRERGAYFLHVGSYSETEEDWEPLFRKDIGAT